MATHTSTKRGRVRTPPQDSETLVRFADGAQQRGDGVAKGDGTKGWALATAKAHNRSSSEASRPLRRRNSAPSRVSGQFPLFPVVSGLPGACSTRVVCQLRVTQLSGFGRLWFIGEKSRRALY
jgi:hypothetical protein